MISREAIMRELELLPAWRLRHTPDAVTENTAVESRSVENPVIESISPEQGTRVQMPQQALQELTPQELTPVVEVLADTASDMHGQSSIQAELSAEITLPLIDELPIPEMVFGAGDPHAEWLFLGIASANDEDAIGLPFAGEAGKLLDNMLAAMQLRRGQNVYLANVLKCHPQDRWDLLPGALSQSDLKPKLMIVFGESAAQSMLKTDAAIDQLRGQLHDYQGVPAVVTYHPADLLSSPEDKRKAWDDLCFAQKAMRTL